MAETVAQGSFGRVLAVVHLQSGDMRALKIACPGNLGEALLLDEFAQLAKLRHPSLPRVFEVGRTTEPIDGIAPGAPFFIAEWIGGGRADDRPWTTTTALWELLADLAGALAVIHAAGLVHGDVAPQNVLVSGDRTVLVDLGLAGARGARGTPAYMAPEAFAGHVEPRSDLYGLGATALRLALGREPFTAPTLGELAHRVVTTPAPVLPARDFGPVSDLVARLCARDVAARPASALAVLDELDEIRPAVAPQLRRRARPEVGPPPAPMQWPGATRWVDELLRGLDSERLQVVIGDAASGAHDLVEEATRRWQLEQAALGQPFAPVMSGSLDEVAHHMATAAAKPRSDEPLAHWLGRIGREVRDADHLVVFALHDDPRSAALIAALARTAHGRPVIVIVDQPPPDCDAMDVRPVPVVDVTGIAELAASMLDRTPPPAWSQSLHRVCHGQPAAAVELLRTIRCEPDPFAIEWQTRSTTSLTELCGRRLRAASRPAQQVALAVAVFGGRVRIDRALATARCLAASQHDGEAAAIELADVVELERAGLARRHDDVVVIDRAVATAAEAIDARRSVACAQAGLDVLAAHAEASADSAAMAALLQRVPLDGRLAQWACDVAAHLLACGRGDRARALAERAVTVEPRRAAWIAAGAAALTGAYGDAQKFALLAAQAGADAVDTQLLIARSSQRAGDLDAAERALSALHARYPENSEAAGAYARLLISRSQYALARQVAISAGPPSGLRTECCGLAALYLGEVDEADRQFATLETEATATGDQGALGRALSLRGMVAQQRGQLALASDRYGEAIQRLRAVGEIHAAAVAELNLGTTLTERGRASDALPRLAAAGRVFADLGATTERIASEINRGNALLALGQVTDAEIAVESGLANAGGVPHLRAFGLLVLGDIKRRLGDDGSALRICREALRIGNEQSDAQVTLSAHIALAELGRPIEADIEARCASDDDRDRWTMARGRVALSRPDDAHATAADWLDHATACTAVALRAHTTDRLERAFRAYSLAARLADRGRDAAMARRDTERARGLHTAIVAAAAPAFRFALDQDPDFLQLPAEAESPSAPHADRSANHLRRLLTLSRRLNSETDVGRILDEVIDTAIELTAAERGFLLLRDDEGHLVPMVSRNLAMADLEANDASVSRSIAERAAQAGEPVITVDAGIDERFAVAASVAALRLRSVLAVPLRQRAVVTGCIYLDHRLRPGAFDDGAAALLGELADIAAIAIENARLADQLRRTTQSVDELNRRLAAELADRDAELVRVKADLPDRDRLRHRYEPIIGRSPAIVRMLDIVDRAAVTALPVVLVGESGTGKELVARALHDASPRRDGAFVAVNCSAVPEPLLESELFGHVRGAFTGAERDRRGLFEVAHKGTLFLDEIADTGAAMQAKLLRVLQDGVIRRVGDTTTRKVDVRVIAATQHPLAELVGAGRFRDDLRFRLEVINIVVPALRDRDGDIPLLVDALIGRFATSSAPRVTRAALRAMCQYSWPGNVRELENVLARGVVLAGDVLDVADLPEGIMASTARPEPIMPEASVDLDLRPALAATERAYIAAAMARANNNQTAAAKLLGLSRFGLQKKLRRLTDEG